MVKNGEPNVHNYICPRPPPRTHGSSQVLAWALGLGAPGDRTAARLLFIVLPVSVCGVCGSVECARSDPILLTLQ